MASFWVYMIGRMIRFLGFLILLAGFGSFSLGLLERENLKEVGTRFLESGNAQKAIPVFKAWVKLEPRSDLAHFYLGRAFLQRYLKKGSQEDLLMGREQFQTSSNFFPRNPEVHYWWANLEKTGAKLHSSENGYRAYVEHMRKACELDPKNYYYYSIYFETLIAFLTDLNYLRSPLAQNLFLDEVSFALNRYLSLKEYYRSEYLALLEAHFDADEREAILSGIQ